MTSKVVLTKNINLLSCIAAFVQLFHVVCCAVLKLLKMAVSVRALLDTVVQALPEVGNLGLLFFLLFYIFAALGVELFGRVGKQHVQLLDVC